MNIEFIKSVAIVICSFRSIKQVIRHASKINKKSSPELFLL